MKGVQAGLGGAARPAIVRLSKPARREQALKDLDWVRDGTGVAMVSLTAFQSAMGCWDRSGEERIALRFQGQNLSQADLPTWFQVGLSSEQARYIAAALVDLADQLDRAKAQPKN